MTGALVLAGLAGWLLVPGEPAAGRRLGRVLVTSRPRRFRLPAPGRWAVLAGPLAGVLAAALLGIGAAVPSAVVGAEVASRWAGRSAARHAATVRAAVPEVCTALAAELRSGRPPMEALAAAVESGPPGTYAELAPVVAAARLGADPAVGLRAAAARPGGAGFAQLAACWAAAETGAGLSRAVQRLAGSLRADAAHRAEVDAQLAGVRATAGLLALLPLFGIALGAALGAAPLTFLLTTSAGAVCGGTAAVLTLVGLRWTDRIAARAART